MKHLAVNLINHIPIGVVKKYDRAADTVGGLL